MSDFPYTPLPPPFLSTWSKHSFMWEVKPVATGSFTVSAVTWATANQARYYPISLPWPYPVRRVWWVNGTTVPANVDFGIYSIDGARIYSTGSTAGSGTSVPQYVDATDFVLPAGDYYFAFNCDDAGAGRLFGNTVAVNHQRFSGVLQEAVGAVTLPAQATFAAASVVGVNLCGITWTPSGF